MVAYILAIQNDNQLYRTTVVTLHTTSGTPLFATISFNSFVDKVVGQFVPVHGVSRPGVRDRGAR